MLYIIMVWRDAWRSRHHIPYNYFYSPLSLSIRVSYRKVVVADTIIYVSTAIIAEEDPYMPRFV